MTSGAALLAFTATAALLTVTPGLDTALVLRTAAAEGPRRAMLAAVGIALGCLGWGLLVGAGLGALLAASQLAYEVLRWAGALYLFHLGLKLIRSPRQAIELGAAQAPVAARPNWLLRGFLTNMLNPKVGVFYVSFLPQFIPAGASVLGWSVLLASIHNLLGLVWFGALVMATRPLLGALRKPGVMAWLDRLTGGLFIAFGLKLALDARA
ncbi:LysE family translocator [Novosphingobium sp.]|uniref:LysE family translocator n=1 Tax=Novosphingobium sp. TaxID=1874826 RepID=UPI0025DBD63B|nr:LysE family translocator [Novosphingobium sp.]MCC6924666.1 LysE family translocator [Novosphingobium sp.]